MILLSYFHRLFGKNAEEVLATPVATPLPLELAGMELPHDEGHTMRTEDQKIIAAIFNDLYSKIGAQGTALEALQTTVANLPASGDDDGPTFDASQVTGYTPAAASGTNDTGTAALESVSGTTGTTAGAISTNTTDPVGAEAEQSSGTAVDTASDEQIAAQAAVATGQA